MRQNKISKSRRKSRGQSFVELALVMPLFIIMLAGMAEVVVVFNDYLQMLDAVRAGARYISDGDPYPTTNTTPGEYDNIKYCTAEDATNAGNPNAALTLNFYRLASCLTEAGLLPIELSPGDGGRVNSGGTCQDPEQPQDDIVISVFGTRVYDDNGNPNDANVIDIKRFDNNRWDTSVSPNTGRLVEDDASSIAGAESGWSFMNDQTNGAVTGIYRYVFGLFNRSGEKLPAYHCPQYWHCFS
jgi:hypothetical protein